VFANLLQIFKKELAKLRFVTQTLQLEAGGFAANIRLILRQLDKIKV